MRGSLNKETIKYFLVLHEFEWLIFFVLTFYGFFFYSSSNWNDNNLSGPSSLIEETTNQVTLNLEEEERFEGFGSVDDSESSPAGSNSPIASPISANSTIK